MEQSSIFTNMHPKASFLFGFVSGIAGGTLVALVLLVSSGGALGALAQNAGTNPIAAAPTPTQPSAQDPYLEPPAGDPPPVTEDDYIRGDKDAKVTLIEYSDYECPFCKQFHPTMQQLLDEFEGQVRWVYRHYPLSFHEPMATKDAEAAECAGELGGNDGFWNMSDLIFERTRSNGNGLTVEQLIDFAGEIGLNETTFKSCLDSGKYVGKIQEQMNAGTAVGVTGTPGTFLIDGDGNSQLISGAVPYANLRATVQAVLQ